MKRATAVITAAVVVAGCGYGGASTGEQSEVVRFADEFVAQHPEIQRSICDRVDRSGPAKAQALLTKDVSGLKKAFAKRGFTAADIAKELVDRC